MTSVKIHESPAVVPPTPDACSELLRWMVGAEPIPHDPEARRLRQQRIAELRREQLVRPAIYVGAGTCGLGAGAQATIDAVRAYLDAHEINADVVKTGCIGLCSVKPIVDIQLPGRARVSFQRVTAKTAPRLLEEVLAGRMPEGMVLGQHRHATLTPWDEVPYLDEHPFFAPQTRWVLANCGLIDPAEIDEYIARGGYAALWKTLLEKTPEQVCEMVEASGLRGRGGGGFPTGTKWKFARNSRGDQKYLICNADEGDPGAFMDRAVIESDPHRLLEGMAIAAYAIGASKAYIYIRAEYPLAIKRLKSAIAQAEAKRLIGQSVLGSSFSLKVVIKMGAGGLVVMDEETCMVDVAKFFMDFIQRESCGKCIPCREGTRRMLEILQRITRGREKERGIEALERFQSVLHLQSLAESIRDTSLCGLGQTAPNPVLSTLRWFRDEYEAHIYDRHCPASRLP